jgi:hypothetical protein
VVLLFLLLLLLLLLVLGFHSVLLLFIGYHYIAQTSLALTFFLPQPPKRWDYKYVPPCPKGRFTSKLIPVAGRIQFPAVAKLK